MITVRFHPKALLDFTESYDYYEDHSAGLGERFIAEADKVIAVVQQHPLRAITELSISMLSPFKSFIPSINLCSKFQ